MPQPVGRVVCVSGSRVVATLDRESEEAAGGRLSKGAIVKLPLRSSDVIAIVSGLSIPVPGNSGGAGEIRLAELELLGEVRREGAGEAPRFRRGIAAYPALGDPVGLAAREDFAVIFREPEPTSIAIGLMHQDEERQVCVSPDDLLGKHVAVIGTTGSGKSCAVTVMLRGLLERHPNAHIVLLDPHNEYPRAFGEHAQLLGPDTLHLPYWLLNTEEIAQVILGHQEQRSRTHEAVAALLTELIPAAKRAFWRLPERPLHITVDTPVPYRLSDVDRLLDEAMGRLDRPETLAPYRWLKARLAVLAADSRYAFMFGGITVHDTMARLLSQIFRIPAAGKPITIIDLSAVPSEILNVVVSVLVRMTFDFALWSRGAQPILLVCEEAHRYAPADPRTGFEPTKEALARVAKEGRKYGVSLCIVSQRPSELATSILSQCNTVFAFRMTSVRDQEFVRGIIADNASGLLDLLPALGDAEAIVAGQAVEVPLRLRLPILPPEVRPQSATASFSRSWRSETLDEAFVAEVVDRWRRQQR